MSNSRRGSAGGTRIVPLPGLYNVRDLGGYPASGGTVKWGLLYRGGDLADPPPDTRAALEGLGIKTIVDFREPEEQRHAPDGEISTLEQSCSLSIRTGSLIDFFGAKNVPDADAMMEELYRKLPAAAVFQYREFFRLLADGGNAPLLFHCSAGKDRTGVAAALALAALGADRETIIGDYMLSAGCLAGKYDALVAGNPVIGPFMTVRRNFIEAALDGIESGMGGMDRYLRETLGVKPELLRELYVEPGAGVSAVPSTKLSTPMVPAAVPREGGSHAGCL